MHYTQEEMHSPGGVTMAMENSTNRLRVHNQGPNSTWLDSTRLDTSDFVEPCFSSMADDEEAVGLACTSLVFCALSIHVNKTEKRRHAVWVKDYL